MLSQRTGALRLGPFSAQAFDVAAHAALRLNLLILIAGVKLIYFLGGAWDIQWHMTIGRDSLFIPPHMLALAGWVGCVAVALIATIHESYLARAGAPLWDHVRLGPISTTPALLGVLGGFLGAAVAIFFDDLWHRALGLDARLWSPPHLALMLCTGLVDLSLVVGIARAAVDAHEPLIVRGRAFWALLLPGALLFDNLRFALGEGVIVGFQAGGAGLAGLLYPILMGILGALPLLLVIGVSGRLWLPALILPLVLALQAIGVGVAQLGFVAMRPVSQMSEFLAANPQSTIGTTLFFCQLNGFSVVGFQEMWVTALSIVPVATMALLHLWPWARRHLLVAAPVHGLVLVLACAIWFRLTPATAAYPTTAADVALAAAIATLGSLPLGWLGLWIARRAAKRGIHSLKA